MRVPVLSVKKQPTCGQPYSIRTRHEFFVLGLAERTRGKPFPLTSTSWSMAVSGTLSLIVILTTQLPLQHSGQYMKVVSPSREASEVGPGAAAFSHPAKPGDEATSSREGPFL